MRSHVTPLPEPPSRRLRVGSCVLNIDCREVMRGNEAPQRITLKAMQVLLVLAAQRGRVVGREALLDAVWAGTMPTDDVVTQAIATLRKALGDDRDAPVYLETIPKSGYRLLAEVEWLADPAPVIPAIPADPVETREEAVLASSRPVSPRQADWRMVAATGLVMLASALLAWWWLSRSPSGEIASSPAAMPAPASRSSGVLAYTLLASRPGPETQPALSPDGALVVYAMPPGGSDAPPALFLQATHATSPWQLTTPPPDHSDHQPRWSPDGRQIMFARIDDKAGCELLLVAASGGATRAVGRCDRVNGRYDWLPDGSGIIAGLEAAIDGAAAPLAIMRLDTGTWQPLAYADAAGTIEFDPRFSPDGKQPAFRRGIGHSNVWAVPTASSQLHRHDFDSGAPRALGAFAPHSTARACLSRWDWLVARATDAGCLDARRRGAATAAPTLSGDGRWPDMSMLGQQESDIGLLRLDDIGT